MFTYTHVPFYVFEENGFDGAERFYSEIIIMLRNVRTLFRFSGGKSRGGRYHFPH